MRKYINIYIYCIEYNKLPLMVFGINDYNKYICE
jgi:hypothetical protein